MTTTSISQGVSRLGIEQKENASDANVDKKCTIGRKVGWLQFSDSQHPGHGHVLEQVLQKAPAIRVHQQRSRATNRNRQRPDGLISRQRDGRASSVTANSPTITTPKMHSPCALLQRATSGSAQIRGAALRAAAARSISHAHTAIPANDTRCGRGIARGSITRKPRMRMATDGRLPTARGTQDRRIRRSRQGRVPAASEPRRLPRGPCGVGDRVGEPRRVVAAGSLASVKLKRFARTSRPARFSRPGRDAIPDRARRRAEAEDRPGGCEREHECNATEARAHRCNVTRWPHRSSSGA